MRNVAGGGGAGDGTGDGGGPTRNGQYYEIRVQGHLDLTWSAWFDGMVLTHDPGGQTVIAGWVRDQAALHGLLAKVRDLHVILLFVQHLEHLERPTDPSL
jgi:hypothetical protein